MSIRGRTARLYLWVAAGSGLGGLLRYLILVAWPVSDMTAFPWPTLIANVTGSLLITLYWMLAGPDGRVLARPEYRVGFTAGFCGGLTSFSVFSLETLILFEGGSAWLAGIYVVTSLVMWMSAAWIGYAWGRRLNR